MSKKIVQNEEEAIKILREIMKTPQLLSVHFEFDISNIEPPTVEYTIRRFAYRMEGED